jgi:protein-tyrosine phosphatase
VQSTVEIRPAGAPAGASPVVFNHLLYGAWPDHGVPALEQRAGLLQFAHLVHAANHAP